MATSTFIASRNPILFGCGVSRQIGEKVREFKCKKVMVVFDKGVQAAGIADQILASLHAAGVETVCFDGVLPDPPDYVVEQAAAIAVAEGVDGVVAVGGGSSLDTGKGVKVLLTNPPPLSQYFMVHEEMVPMDPNMKPVFILPTTCGTGSEATPGGVITDSRNNYKRNISCPTDLALVDPELALGLPAAVTATTAADALCHAIEAYTSSEPNLISDLLAKEAISLIGKNLVNIINDGSDLAGREGLQLAATLAGMALLGPFCNVPHETGLPLGILFHIPHGTACAATMPEAMEFLAPVIPDRVRTVVELLGGSVPAGAAPEEIGKIAHRLLRELYAAIRLPGLKSYVGSKQELLDAIPFVMQISPYHFSPRPVSAGDLAHILETAYDESL